MTLVSTTRPVALIGGTGSETEILRNYAEFWKIPYRIGFTEGELPAFATGNVALREGADAVPIVVTPSGEEQAEKIANDNRLQRTSKTARLTLPLAPDVEVSIQTQVHEFSGSNLEPLLRCGEISILSRLRGTSVYLLSVDLIGDYSRSVHGGFEENPSLKFRIATKLPFSYQAIPRFIRDRTFRASHSLNLLKDENIGPVEFLRTLFLASLVLVSGPIPRIRFWKRGKSYSLAVTHDVESLDGLENGTPRLLSVERDLGLRSTWNLPSERYALSKSVVLALGDSGEIGGHDTRHDGRLVLLGTDGKLERLKLCKSRLEELSEKRVRGFRAPLLQHSPDLASAENIAGFEYDSSCPSWEILSPTSLRPHGVGTIFPFEVGGILEIPVSLPQDHQLMRVAGLGPPATVDMLLRLSRWIRGLGGPCVLLIHPDYELGSIEWESEYRRLLEHYASDPSCHTMTLGEMADWWRYRAGVGWDTTNGSLRIVLPDGGKTGMEIEAELVTGYGSHGFVTEPLPS